MKHSILVVFILSVLAIGIAFAADPEPEQIELTTYYPAPYGDYDELSSETIYSNRIAIGDTNNDGFVNENDIPEPGKIAIEKSAIYSPRAGDPTGWGTGTAGELAYSSNNNAFYYNSGGSNWAAIGGGGGSCYTVFAFGEASCYAGYTPVATGSAYATYIGDGNPGIPQNEGPNPILGGGFMCVSGNWKANNWTISLSPVLYDDGVTETAKVNCAICCK